MDGLSAFVNVAGVVEVGATLFRAATEAGKLWSDVHKFPDDVEKLLWQLERTEQLLLEISKQSLLAGVPEGLWEKSLTRKLFERALDSLFSAIYKANQLQRETKSPKRWRREMKLFKVSFKRKDLDDLVTEFERTSDLLDKGWRAWENTIRRYEQERFRESIITEVTRVIRAGTAGNLESNGSKDQTMVHVSAPAIHSVQPTFIGNTTCASSWYGKAGCQWTTQGWAAYWRAPTWLTRKVWELHYVQNFSSVAYNLRTYNVVSDSAQVFGTIACGDVAGMLELFQSGQASPFDRDQLGRSLLHYAVREQQYDVCKALVDIGGVALIDDRTGSNQWRESPLDRVFHSFGYGVSYSYPLENAVGVHADNSRQDAIANLFRARLRGANSLPAMRVLDFVRECSINDEQIQEVLRIFKDDYYEWPSSERLEAVRYGSLNIHGPKTLRKLLHADGVISDADVTDSIKAGISLIHTAAITLGLRYAAQVLSEPTLIDPCRLYCCCWSRLVSDLGKLAQPEDLHSIETVTAWEPYCVPQWTGTPLISLLGGALCHLCPRSPPGRMDRVLHEVMKHWLETLREAGIDLVDYGKREEEACKSRTYDFAGAFDSNAIQASKRVVYPPMDRHTYGRDLSRAEGNGTVGYQYSLPLRLFDLKYGQRIEDWNLSWGVEVEVLAAEFWELVEMPEVNMPGGWDDCC